jgi:hypothetical protein
MEDASTYEPVWSMHLCERLRKSISCCSKRWVVDVCITKKLSDLCFATQACVGIYPLTNVFVRKVKILKAPKFDIGKLMEVHGDFTEEVRRNPLCFHLVNRRAFSPCALVEEPESSIAIC